MSRHPRVYLAVAVFLVLAAPFYAVFALMRLASNFVAWLDWTAIPWMRRYKQPIERKIIDTLDAIVAPIMGPEPIRDEHNPTKEA